MIDATLSNEQYLRDLEKSFAFERASGVIESSCLYSVDGLEKSTWFDLNTSDEDISQEIEYLDSRHLLTRHPDHPNWVMICDEDEPCMPAEAAPVDAYKELT